MNEQQAQQYQKEHPDIKLRSAEECYYHQIFMKAFDNPDALLTNVARWAETRF